MLGYLSHTRRATDRYPARLAERGSTLPSATTPLSVSPH